ncbi:aspartic peptidase domain-containing protein [Ilyonectria robusta]|uniref:aspartic peptidase domain-containing protein n=1 Tax=Ilyonectria robusta TaxID=1079257 RepID=UPI001E8D7741|nr:aspartic peptidase domain-containing protein [Ilyonectria robusta]KAH8647520.1 aspartic peptidase domain-containing protein [Ilyonectria robusta]
MMVSSAWPWPDRRTIRLFVLLAASQASKLASAQCTPSTVVAKIGNVTITNGEVVRAIPLAIGTPETDFAFLPQWPANNTIVYGRDGYCGARFPESRQACTTWRGGQYDVERSETNTIPPLNAYPREDIGEYPEMNFFADTVRINDEVSLADLPLAMPIATAISDGPISVFHPRFAIGLGKNSTMLNRLLSKGLIKSRTWSMFWGLFGAEAENQMDGSFIFGGYDTAKVKGRGFKHTMREPFDDCPTGMMVTISDVSVEFPNGSISTLFPESRSAAMMACILPDYPTILQLPLDPYFNTFKDLTGTNVTTASTGGTNMNSMVYKTSEGEEPFKGDLTITLQSGLTVRFPSHQLVVPERTIQQNTGKVAVDGSNANLLLTPDVNPSLSKLGQMFLSSAYLMVNEDADEFTLWEANPTTDENIVALDENGVKITESCEGAPEEESETPGLSTGAIAGIVLGVIAGVVLVMSGIVLFLRRRRRLNQPSMAAVSISRPLSGGRDGRQIYHKSELAAEGGSAELAGSEYDRDGYRKPELENTVKQLWLKPVPETPQHELPG